MTPVIFIYYTPDWQPLADIVLPRVEAYCERHGYKMMKVTDEGAEVTGLRKMRVLSHLFDHFSLIWLLDLDTLITNPSIPFTQFTDNEHDIFITKDVHGINAGSFIIRNTEASRNFIQAVIYNFGDAGEEQTVMKQYLDMVRVKYLPHPSINSYMYELYEDDDCKGITHEQGQWQKGDLLLHLPGTNMDTRINTFTKLCTPQ